MTLSSLRSGLFADASWREPEAWPRQTQWLAIGVISTVYAALLGTLIMWPRWQKLASARLQQAQDSAERLTQTAVLSAAPSRSEELRQLRKDRVDPASYEAVEHAFAGTTPLVSVNDVDGVIAIDGEGSFTQLEMWLASVLRGPNLPLLSWRSFRVATHANTLSWVGQLQRVETSLDLPTTDSDSHAIAVGRDPFATGAVVESGTAAGAVVNRTSVAPSEESWPRPSVTDWPIANLRMVGNVGESSVRAVLMAGSRSLYVVHVGQAIGQERRVVRHISDTRVLAGDDVVAFAPQVIERVP